MNKSNKYFSVKMNVKWNGNRKQRIESLPWDVSKRVLWEWQFDRENRLLWKDELWTINKTEKHDDKICVKMEDAKEYLWFKKMDEFAKKY